MDKSAVILVNLGAPSAPKAGAIRAFLRCFLSDKRVAPLPWLVWQPILNLIILPFLPKKLVKQYADIWLPEGSPLKVFTENLAKAVSERSSSNQVVYHAMSYSCPFLSKVIQNCLAEGYSRLVILPLYPQYASSTTGAVFDQVFRALYKQRYIPSLHLINGYYDHPLYNKAIVESIKTYWQKHPKPQKLIISFYGIPQSSVEKGDPYAKQCEATAEALAQALSLDRSKWQLVYQSRFGKAEWLQPYCSQVLQELPKKGITDVHVICPGFAIDCLETLEEITETNRDIFLEAGGKSYRYIPALNASELQCDLIQSLIEAESA